MARFHQSCVEWFQRGYLKLKKMRIQRGYLKLKNMRIQRAIPLVGLVGLLILSLQQSLLHNSATTPNYSCSNSVAPEPKTKNHTEQRGRNCHKFNLDIKGTFSSEEFIIQNTYNCSKYMELKKKRFQNFPLAFGISTYHQVGILELFLASSFHPLDSYCIHVDAKAKDLVKTAINQLMGCYQWKYPEANIFIVDDPVAVFWGHFSVLEADFKCMRLLRDNYKDWNLYLNLAGTELPLKPMPEIRRILQNFPDGILNSYAVPSYHMNRFEVSMELKRIGQGDFDLELVKTDHLKDLPPGNITLRKGSRYVALSPYLVDIFLDSPYCHEFLNWISDTHIPDEHFYSTMITKFNRTTQNIQDKQDLDTDFTQGVCLRLTWWDDGNCRGKSIRGVCNFGQEDLPRLHKDTKCLFGNKFNLDVDAVAPIQHILHVLET